MIDTPHSPDMNGVEEPGAGRSVHVDITGNGDWRPAIVTQNWGGLSVNLTVFLDPANDMNKTLRAGLYGGPNSGFVTAYATSVQHKSITDEDNLSWCWFHEHP